MDSDAGLEVNMPGDSHVYGPSNSFKMCWDSFQGNIYLLEDLMKFLGQEEGNKWIRVTYLHS